MAWKRLEGSNYEFSDKGEVRNTRFNRKLDLRVNKNGYHDVSVTIDGKNRCLEVHRVVAKLFIPNPLGLPQVNHRDEDKLNNSVQNLAWCTVSENVRHSLLSRRRPKPRRFLTEVEKINIRHIGDSEPTTRLGRLYGVDRRTISRSRV